MKRHLAMRDRAIWVIAVVAVGVTVYLVLPIWVIARRQYCWSSFPCFFDGAAVITLDVEARGSAASRSRLLCVVKGCFGGAGRPVMSHAVRGQALMKACG